MSDQIAQHIRNVKSGMSAEVLTPVSETILDLQTALALCMAHFFILNHTNKIIDVPLLLFYGEPYSSS